MNTWESSGYKPEIIQKEDLPVDIRKGVDVYLFGVNDIFMKKTVEYYDGKTEYHLKNGYGYFYDLI